jgi:hypothetical protein
MSEIDPREGGCACGSLRYRAQGEPIFVNNCHCRLCQRQTGGTSVVNAFYESDRVEVLQGKLTEHVVKSGSGGDHTICRCAECGTAVFSYYPRVGRLGVGIRVGSFDDPTVFTPTAVVFAASRMPWVTLPEGVPAFDEYYDLREVYSPESLARIMALVERKKAE